MIVSKNSLNLFEASFTYSDGKRKRSVGAIFDTGSSITSLPQNVIKALRLQGNNKTTKSIDVNGCISLKKMYYVTLIIDCTDITVSVTENNIDKILIGTDVILQGKLVIENDVLEFTV